MRIQTSLSATFLIVFSVLSPSDVAAQASAKTPGPTPRATVAATKCHTLLTGFQGKSEDYFAHMTDEELSSINDSVYECATNSYSLLSRLDLAVGAVAAAMVARQAQDRHDAVEYNALQKQYDQLRVKMKQNENPTDTVPVASNPRTVTVTISPLPNGITRTLMIGGSLDVCTGVASMKFECKKNVGSPLGSIVDTYLVAMFATRKDSPIFGGSTYLIGCREDLSSNCFPIVPGDYEAELVGADGITISGLVSEDKPNAPPHHGIFVIYGRRE